MATVEVLSTDDRDNRLSIDVSIGNYLDNAHTVRIAVKDTTGSYLGTGGVTWYLVDDISVIKSDATIDAGPDRVMPATGDSVIIGDTLDSYLPVIWYVNGVAIDSNSAWIKVHPDTTTTYVVALLKCSGDVSLDTVTVWVATTGLQSCRFTNLRIYPNPVSNTLTIENAHGAVLTIYNIVGESVYEAFFASGKEELNIEALPAAVYFAQIIDPVSGMKKTVKIVKE